MTTAEPKTYALTADAIYDLIATGFGIGASIMASGYMTKELQDRVNIVELVKRHQPFYAMEVAIEWSNLGRPGGAVQIEFMEKEIALAMEHGDFDHAGALRDAVNELKMGREI